MEAREVHEAVLFMVFRVLSTTGSPGLQEASYCAGRTRVLARVEASLASGGHHGDCAPQELSDVGAPGVSIVR